MQMYEYKVVAAPNQSRKVRGVKTPAGRFAVVLTEAINEQAAEGWEYLRSDSLPVEEKPGLLKSKVENYYTVLVFRRPVADAGVEAADVAVTAAPVIPVAAPDPQVEETHREPVIGHSHGEDDFPADPPLRGREVQDDIDSSGEEGNDESPFAEDSDTDREVIR